MVSSTELPSTETSVIARFPSTTGSLTIGWVVEEKVLKL